jgi:hypothetical protein
MTKNLFDYGRAEEIAASDAPTVADVLEFLAIIKTAKAPEERALARAIMTTLVRTIIELGDEELLDALDA